MKQANILLLGIGIAYAALALIQWIQPALFPISLYLGVAWASLCISILEMIRSANQLFRTNIQRMDKSNSAQQEIMNRLSAVLQNYDNLKSESEAVNAASQELEDNRKERQKYQKIVHILMIVEKVLTIIQVAMCGLMLILTPLRKIPNDIENNKVLGVLGLITFAMLFFSAYFQNRYDLKDMQEKQTEFAWISNYYLNLMEKMTEKESGKSEETK